VETLARVSSGPGDIDITVTKYVNDLDDDVTAIKKRDSGQGIKGQCNFTNNCRILCKNYHVL
jgi:hypothetical protein